MERIDLPTRELVRLYTEGTSEKALAARFAVSRTVIKRNLTEAGVERRNKSAAMYTRMAQASPEERQRLSAAAHDAVRGKPQTLDHRMKRARTVEALGKMQPTEQAAKRILEARGITSVPQKAIGPYNCDLGCAPVAVEIFGGNWHFTGLHMARTPKRLRYMMDEGWHVLMIVVSRQFPITGEVADYAVSWIQERRSNPAMVREYRVVRGAGQLISSGCAEDDDVSIVSAFTHSRDTQGRYCRIPK